MVNGEKKTEGNPDASLQDSHALKDPGSQRNFHYPQKNNDRRKKVRSIRVKTMIASHYRKMEQYQQKEKPALTMKQTLDLNLHQSGNGT